MGAVTDQTFASSIYPAARVTKDVCCSVSSPMHDYIEAFFHRFILWLQKTQFDVHETSSDKLLRPNFQLRHESVQVDIMVLFPALHFCSESLYNHRSSKHILWCVLQLCTFLQAVQEPLCRGEEPHWCPVGIRKIEISTHTGGFDLQRWDKIGLM